MNVEHREIVYGKLVRDRIPEMIEAEGYQPQIRKLDENEYLKELHRKLREETQEYLESESQEEIADILEVLEAICAVKNFSIEDILNCKTEKKKERGGFEQRLFLISKK